MKYSFERPVNICKIHEHFTPRKDNYRNSLMTIEKSALQIARAAYQAKLPSVFSNGAKVAFAEGAPTTAADDAEQINELFPKTYGAPIISFEAGDGAESKVINAGVILSGGQGSWRS